MFSDRGTPDCGQAGGRDGLVTDWSDNCQGLCVFLCVCVHAMLNTKIQTLQQSEDIYGM